MAVSFYQTAWNSGGSQPPGWYKDVTLTARFVGRP